MWLVYLIAMFLINLPNDFSEIELRDILVQAGIELGQAKIYLL